MGFEQQLHDGFVAMLNDLEVPEPPLAGIRARIEGPVPSSASLMSRRWLATAASVAVVATIALPLAAPAVVESLEARVAAILHWTPPAQPIPTSLRPALQGSNVDFEAARKAVNFALVAPAGLPGFAKPSFIRVASAGIYSAQTHAWTRGSKYVEFGYQRADGGDFVLIAASAESLRAPLSRYMFEDRGADKAGNPILVRRERFVWRNGDQVTAAIVSEHLSAAEIVAIRDAMHGIPIATAWPPTASPNAVKMLIHHP